MMKVTQADREAAARLMADMPFGGVVGSVEVRDGGNDNHKFAQAFAAHAAQARQEVLDSAKPCAVALFQSFVRGVAVKHKWTDEQVAFAVNAFSTALADALQEQKP